jgi:hypothetical protein
VYDDKGVWVTIAGTLIVAVVMISMATWITREIPAATSEEEFRRTEDLMDALVRLQGDLQVIEPGDVVNLQAAISTTTPSMYAPKLSGALSTIDATESAIRVIADTTRQDFEEGMWRSDNGLSENIYIGSDADGYGYITLDNNWRGNRFITKTTRTLGVTMNSYDSVFSARFVAPGTGTVTVNSARLFIYNSGNPDPTNPYKASIYITEDDNHGRPNMTPGSTTRYNISSMYSGVVTDTLIGSDSIPKGTWGWVTANFAPTPATLTSGKVYYLVLDVYGDGTWGVQSNDWDYLVVAYTEPFNTVWVDNSIGNENRSVVAWVRETIDLNPHWSDLYWMEPVFVLDLGTNGYWGNPYHGGFKCYHEDIYYPDINSYGDNRTYITYLDGDNCYSAGVINSNSYPGNDNVWGENFQISQPTTINAFEVSVDRHGLPTSDLYVYIENSTWSEKHRLEPEDIRTGDTLPPNEDLLTPILPEGVSSGVPTWYRITLDQPRMLAAGKYWIYLRTMGDTRNDYYRVPLDNAAGAPVNMSWEGADSCAFRASMPSGSNNLSGAVNLQLFNEVDMPFRLIFENYQSPAMYTSPVLAPDKRVKWLNLTWDDDTPADTNITVQVRVGDMTHPENPDLPDDLNYPWSEWKDVQKGQDLGEVFGSDFVQGIDNRVANALQYRIKLSANPDNTLAPIVRAVCVRYFEGVGTTRAPLPVEWIQTTTGDFRVGQASGTENIHIGEDVVTLGSSASAFWTTLTGPPVGAANCNGHRIGTIGGKVYYWVGTGDTPGTEVPTIEYGMSIINKQFYVYDPSNPGDGWTRLTDVPFAPESNYVYSLGVSEANNKYGDPAIYAVTSTAYNNSMQFACWTESEAWTGLSTDLSSLWYGCYKHGEGSYTIGKTRNGAEMVWDGADAIYLFPGSGYGYSCYDWYKYTISTNKWSAMTPAIPGTPHGAESGDDPKNGPGNAACRVVIGGDTYIYVQFGHTPSGAYESAQFWRIKVLPTLGSWEQRTKTKYGADDGSDLVWDKGDTIYAMPGAYEEGLSASEESHFLRYSISKDTWEELLSIPVPSTGGVDDGGSMVMIGNNIYVLKGGSDTPAGGGSTADNYFFSYGIPAYLPQGAFVSTFDAGEVVDWKSIEFENVTPANTSFSLDVRFSNDNSSWSDWENNVKSGQSLEGNTRYVQYRANMATTDNTYAPILNRVSISYTPISIESLSQTDWSGGSTSPTLEAGTWPSDYNRYNNAENIDATVSVGDIALVSGSENRLWGDSFRVDQVLSSDNLNYVSDRLSLRFRARRTENVYGVRVYVESYDRAQLVVEVDNDNAGNPGENITTENQVDISSTGWLYIGFSTPAALVKNNVYHIVVRMVSLPRWVQTDWKGGPTKPSLQVGTWGDTYDNFYDNENVDWSSSGAMKLTGTDLPFSQVGGPLYISLLLENDTTTTVSMRFDSSESIYVPLEFPRLTITCTDGTVYSCDGAIDDTTVQQGYNVPQGSSGSLYVGYYTAFKERERVYLKFNPSMDANKTISSAYLSMYDYDTTPANSWINVHAVLDDSWSESTLVWDTQPTFDSRILDSQYINNTVGTRFSWDITSFVENLYENSVGATIFPDNGSFESSIYDVGSSAGWGVVTWDASTPSQAFVDDYAYVTSYDDVKGTVTDFVNEQDSNDGGAYATLAEKQEASGTPITIFSDSFDTAINNEARYDSWWPDSGWRMLSSNAGGPKQGAGKLGLLTSGTYGPPAIWIPSFATTGYSNIHISFKWAKEYNPSDTRTNTFAAQWSTDASTWENIENTSYTPDIDGSPKIISDLPVGSDAQVGNKPALYIRWYSDDGSGSGARDKVSFDDVVITGITMFDVYAMDIRENIESIPSAVTYTLEMEYKRGNTNDSFKVQVWNGSAWNARGDNLTSYTSWADWSYTLQSSEVNSGKVQVRFVDNNPISTAKGSLLIGYLRVWSQAAPFSTSLVVKLRTGGTQTPDGSWSGWYTHGNNTENTSMPDNRYVQYRIELSTTNITRTPELLDITLRYSGVVSVTWTQTSWHQGSGQTTWSNVNMFNTSENIDWENSSGELRLMRTQVGTAENDNVGAEPTTLRDGKPQIGSVVGGSITNTRTQNRSYETIQEANVAAEKVYHQSSTYLENGTYHSGSLDDMDNDDGNYYHVDAVDPPPDPVNGVSGMASAGPGDGAGLVGVIGGLTSGTDGTNLITNPSWDSDMSGWSNTDVSLVRNTASQYIHSGSGSVKLTAISVGSGYIFTSADPGFSVSPLTDYLVRGYIYDNDVKVFGYIEIRWYYYNSGNLTNTFIGSTRIGEYSTDSTFWQVQAATVTSPSNANNAKLRLYEIGSQGGVIYYDDVYVGISSPPTVTKVASTAANGAYTVNQVIPVTVTFSENVIVTGTPQLTLATGGAGTAVNCTGGSGTATLTFNYTVAAGDNSADLDYVATNSLVPNGGTIKDNAADNVATLTLPTPGAEGSLGANKDIVIDTTAPTVSTYNPVDDAAGVAVDANLVLTFSENIFKGTTGNIVIYKSDDTMFETIAVTDDAKVTVNGATVTINPAGTFASLTEYYVKIDSTCFKDVVGYYYAGIADNTTWNFTVAMVYKIRIIHDSENVRQQPGTIENIVVKLNLCDNTTATENYHFDIYNWSSGLYELETSALIGTSEENLVITVLNPANYISSSDNVRVRLWTTNEYNPHRVMEDYLAFKVTMVPQYDLRWEHTIENVATGWENYKLKMYGYRGSDEDVTVYVWNNTNSQWISIGPLPTTADLVENTIYTSYLDAGKLYVKYESADNTDDTQTNVYIDQCIVEEENVAKYYSRGRLISSAYDSGNTETMWGLIKFDNLTPAGSALAIEVQVDNNNVNWPSSWVPVKSGDNIGRTGRYARYRVSENANADSTQTPILQDISINLPMTLVKNVIGRLTLRVSTPLNGNMAYDGLTPDDANVLYDNGLGWENRNRQPIYVLDVDTNADGSLDAYDGNPYAVAGGMAIWGGNYAGETFTISSSFAGGSHHVRGVRVYVRKVGAPGDSLYYELWDLSNGTRLENGILATASQVGSSWAQVSKVFSNEHLFVAGRTYRLYLKSPSSSNGNYYEWMAPSAGATGDAYEQSTYGGTSLYASYRSASSWSNYNGRDAVFSFIAARGYTSGGWLESSVFDIGRDVSWEIISWSAVTSSQTTVRVEARTGGDDDPDDEGWIDWKQVANGGRVPENRYVQYRVILNPPNDNETPIFQSVTIRYPKGAPPEAPENLMVRTWAQTTQADFLAGRTPDDIGSNVEVVSPGDLTLMAENYWGNQFVSTSGFSMGSRLDSENKLFDVRFVAEEDEIVNNAKFLALVCLDGEIRWPTYSIGKMENIYWDVLLVNDNNGVPDLSTSGILGRARGAPYKIFPDTPRSQGPVDSKEISMEWYMPYPRLETGSFDPLPQLTGGQTYHLVITVSKDNANLINRDTWINIVSHKRDSIRPDYWINGETYNTNRAVLFGEYRNGSYIWENSTTQGSPVDGRDPMYLLGVMRGRATSVTDYEGDPYYKSDEEVYTNNYVGQRIPINKAYGDFSGDGMNIGAIELYMKGQGDAGEAYVGINLGAENLAEMTYSIPLDYPSRYSWTRFTLPTSYTIWEGETYNVYIKSPSSTPNNYGAVDTMKTPWETNTKKPYVQATYGGGSSLYIWSYDGNTWDTKEYREVPFRFVTGYAQSGDFESGVFDAGQVVDWKYIEWDETRPAGTDIKLYVIANGERYGPFSNRSSLENVPDSRNISYKVEMTTNDPAKSPALHEVRIGYRGGFGSLRIELQNQGQGRTLAYEGGAVIVKQENRNTMYSMPDDMIVDSENDNSLMLDVNYRLLMNPLSVKSTALTAMTGVNFTMPEDMFVVKENDNMSSVEISIVSDFAQAWYEYLQSVSQRINSRYLGRYNATPSRDGYEVKLVVTPTSDSRRIAYRETVREIEAKIL